MEGFNLAFLDIMACGLGAIILVFMLVKNYGGEAEVVGDGEVAVLGGELVVLEEEVTALVAVNEGLVAGNLVLEEALLRGRAAAEVAELERVEAEVEEVRLVGEIEGLEEELARELERVGGGEDEAVEEVPEERHLLGLRVRGERILIMVDRSASMAAERLVDIIKVKAGGVSVKQGAAKWRRAVGVARWLMARLPVGSEWRMMQYGEGAGYVGREGWQAASDGAARREALVALEGLYPDGATNLHVALGLVEGGVMAPTDVYLVTDSLPTSGLDELPWQRWPSGCGPSRRATTVSGRCRLGLFYSAIKIFGARVGARVNSVLLPIEGDPDAGYAYWLWSATTTGTMISPAGGWP